ncbi:PREDICTED: protein Iojap-related, mitochondrial isoform X2 [Camelina sativa]|uniref:Protein Iojap-related, mitochondrial isoform X2 n=1 Tax=Camelina sativa TaxID=90675 RepID=A0ABM0U7J0_CAMSA|nr:PREDICTED: protein Iojap-related, mitochondrial isoform X2 [Camelina sativa]
MLSALRSRCSSLLQDQSWKLCLSSAPNRILACSPFFSSTSGAKDVSEILMLPEVEKILTDVKADNVTLVPTHNHCFWADYMVVATGRSDWHLKNIAQALVYKTKQKQKDAKHIMLPSVQGYDSKWIVIDYGKFVVHALDEKARVYFNLENLWTAETYGTDSSDLQGHGNIICAHRYRLITSAVSIMTSTITDF